MIKITLRDALRDAMAEEMRRDDTVFVMGEDVARTVHLARQVGEPLRLDQADIDRLFDRYQNVYGQGISQ